MVWEKIFKGFSIWLPWQQEFFKEHNYLREFPVKFGKNPVNSFWREVFLQEKFTDACTDKQTHDRHNAMNIARWPSASVAKNCTILAILILSSANAFKLDKGKILSSAKGLTVGSTLRSIDCMVFNAVFNSISVISRCPVHLSTEFFWPILYTIFYPRLLSHITIIETRDSSERGMNPVTITIINPLKEYWLSLGLNQWPPVFESAMLPTELWGLAQLYNVKRGLKDAIQILNDPV